MSVGGGTRLWLREGEPGPEDDPDPSVNGDPDSLCGEEDGAGFDDMPAECGWEDEGEDEDEGDEGDPGC